MSPLLAIQAELERAYAASDSYLALVRRVHAECGPKNLSGGRFPLITCSCNRTAPTNTSGYIKHSDDCLWLAAEAVLKGVGEL